MRRRRRFLSIALLCLLALTGIALCQQIIAQKAVETIFTQITGFPIRVDSVQIAPWDSRFAATDIKLFNPPEFSEQLFADIPRFDVDYKAGSFLTERPHLTRADLHIRELLIVKNTNGDSNVEQLRGWRTRGAAPHWPGVGFQIDTLNLRLGSVRTIDYSGGRAKERTRHLNMALTFRNVTETTDLNRKIFYAVLKRMWFGPMFSATKSQETER